MYDIAVLGGGPAGLSAAVNARARNKTVVVISNDWRENALFRAAHVPNYPGLPDISGQELLERLHLHAEKMGTEFITKRLISALHMGASWGLSAEDTLVEARTLILASGIIRSGKFAGESELLGRGVSYCATCDGMLYRQKRVVVYGETDAAEREANYLKEIGCVVVYLSRRTGSGALKDTIPFIQMKHLEIHGGSKVEYVLIDGQKVLCDGVFLLRASVSPMDLIEDLALQDSHIKVDRSMATNLPGVYAAGDCTGKPYQIAKAAGEGQVAALAAVAWLDQQV